MATKSRAMAPALGFSLIELLLVVGLVGVLSAISVPVIGTTMAGVRLSGSARSISSAMALAKIRAGSSFSRVRLYSDLTTGSHHLEWLDSGPSPDHWTVTGGTTSVATGVTFSYGPVSTPPPNSQGTVGDTPSCMTDLGEEIPETWCITFNSRGIPVDASGAANAAGVIYLTNGAGVFGVTVKATGMIGMWRTVSQTVPRWTPQ